MSPELITTLKELAPFAPLASALIFALSLGLGLLQIRRNGQNQRRATAIALWDKYLDRTIQFPKFACPKSFPGAFDFEKLEIDESPEKFEQYEWFVASLIRTSNEILGNYDRRKERLKMVRRNIEYHKRYIAFKPAGFFKDLGRDVGKIVEDIAKEYAKEVEGKQEESAPRLAA